MEFTDAWSLLFFWLFIIFFGLTCFVSGCGCGRNEEKMETKNEK